MSTGIIFNGRDGRLEEGRLDSFNLLQTAMSVAKTNRDTAKAMGILPKDNMEIVANFMKKSLVIISLYEHAVENALYFEYAGLTGFPYKSKDDYRNYNSIKLDYSSNQSSMRIKNTVLVHKTDNGNIMTVDIQEQAIYVFENINRYIAVNRMRAVSYQNHAERFPFPYNDRLPLEDICVVKSLPDEKDCIVVISTNKELDISSFFLTPNSANMKITYRIDIFNYSLKKWESTKYMNGYSQHMVRNADLSALSPLAMEFWKIGTIKTAYNPLYKTVCLENTSVCTLPGRRMFVYGGMEQRVNIRLNDDLNERSTLAFEDSFIHQWSVVNLASGEVLKTEYLEKSRVYAACQLIGREVLITGGIEYTEEWEFVGVDGTTEIFNIDTMTFVTIPKNTDYDKIHYALVDHVKVNVFGHTTLSLPDGGVLIVGGLWTDNDDGVVRIYPATMCLSTIESGWRRGKYRDKDIMYSEHTPGYYTVRMKVLGAFYI